MKLLLALLLSMACFSYSQIYRPNFEGMDEIRWYFDPNSLSYINQSGFSDDLSAVKVEALIQQACDEWDRVISSKPYKDNIKFSKGTLGNHNIKISFYAGSNSTELGNTNTINDYSPYDAIPLGEGAKIEINKNVNIIWKPNSASSGPYLYNTLLHEIGHAVFGMFRNVHSVDPVAVMYSGFSSNVLVLNVVGAEAVLAYNAYNHCNFTFIAQNVQRGDKIQFTDPRIFVNNVLQEDYITLDNKYEVMSHGQTRARSYNDLNLLLGSTAYLNQNGTYDAVTSWLINSVSINSPKAQFISQQENSTVTALYSPTHRLLFNPGNFLEGGGQLNYYDYAIGENIEKDTIKYGDNERYYTVDKIVRIYSHTPNEYYAMWNYGNPNLTANDIQIQMSSNITLNANYKGKLKSNNLNTLNSNSSHKFIKTNDGIYHLVYNSLGKVWYESSTDDGTSWSLRYSDDGDLPAIAAVNNSRVVIVYPSNTQYIKAVCFDNSSPTQVSTSSTLGREIDIPSDLSIAINSSGKIAIAYYNSMDDGGDALPGYYGLAGSISSSGVITWGSNSNYRTGALASSTAKNGVMEVRSESPEILFHFAFDDVDANEDRQIYYGPLKWSSTTLTRYVYSPYNNCLSGSSGYQNNTNPSLIPWSGEGFRINWIGNVGSPYAASVFRDPSNPTFWTFGSNVLSTSMNKASDGYEIGWSNGTLHNYANNSNLYSLGSISSNGQFLQIGNSNTRATMRAIGFNTSVSPYQFNLSTPIGAPLQKGSSVDENEILGRGIVISLNHKEEIPDDIDSTTLNHSYQKNAQYSYLANNIVVDENRLTFIDLPVGEQLMTPETINNHLVTNPFVLKNSSSFSFDIVSEVVNSNTEAGSVLNEKGFVKFTVELIDVVTGQIYEVQSKFVKTNSSSSGVMVTSYTVDCEGVGEKEFQLRIKFTTTELAEYALIEKISNGSDNLQKSGSEKLKIAFTKNAIVSDYSLSQNYPNPFNPVTVISYALPKAGHVSISVYDALGREVAQLIHGEQNAGRHTVNFDASKLSSGIYLYKMTSGTFSETRKMLLMK